MSLTLHHVELLLIDEPEELPVTEFRSTQVRHLIIKTQDGNELTIVMLANNAANLGLHLTREHDRIDGGRLLDPV